MSGTPTSPCAIMRAVARALADRVHDALVSAYGRAFAAVTEARKLALAWRGGVMRLNARRPIHDWPTPLGWLALAVCAAGVVLLAVVVTR